MNIPSEYELAGEKPYCLDTAYMLKRFLGKDKEEAIYLFKNDGVSEDFAYMNSSGLSYYLEAALEYLKSEDSRDDEWGFLIGLLCSLHCQVTLWNVAKHVIPLIKEVAEYCRANMEKLDLDKNDPLLNEYLRSIENA